MHLNPKPLHYFSVDVEDYFQVSAFDRCVSRDAWPSYESRVVENTNRLLDLLSQFNVKATFYILGWVAGRYPDLVSRIDELGHVIGSHTYWHNLIYNQSPMEFAVDLAQSCDAISRVTGKPVKHFRAPSFSITRRNPWAVEILARAGIEFDSSIVPIRHDRYGIPGTPAQCYTLRHQEASLHEFPVSVLPLGKGNIPCGGGGYFRIFPWWWTKLAYKKLEAAGRSIHFYIHPWEIDPQQPRVQGVGKVSRFRHYRNLGKTYDRMCLLLKTFSFGKTAYPEPKNQWRFEEHASAPKKVSST